jgi:hypothetical protein
MWMSNSPMSHHRDKNLPKRSDVCPSKWACSQPSGEQQVHDSQKKKRHRTFRSAFPNLHFRELCDLCSPNEDLGAMQHCLSLSKSQDDSMMMWRRATHQSCLSIIVINLIIIRPIRTYVRQTFTECTCADLMSLFGNDRWTDYAKVRTSSMPMCSLNSQVYAPPNEDFRRRNKRWNANFEGSTFQWFVAQIEYSHPWNVLPSKSTFHLLFLLSKSSFYAPQTKILEGRTNLSEWGFEALSR